MFKKYLQFGLLVSIIYFEAYAEKKMAPLIVTQQASLQLGTLVSGSGLQVIEAGNSPSSPSAKFKVQGEPNASFTFILPTQVTLVHEKSKGNKIVLSSFTSNPSNNSGTFDSKGIKYIYVGASVNVTNGILPGEYTGSINLEVIYD
jgi:hypothetical protein